jgi:hypothetical protein
MPPVGALAKRTKKIDNKQLSILRKQESAYFKQTHRLRLDTDAVNANAIPLLNPHHPLLPLPLHPDEPPPSLPRGGQMFNIAKAKLKLQLQKTSTMDEETSRENHINNRDKFS